MLGLMQDQPLLISSLIEFAARHHASAEIVSRRVEGDLHRYTYADAARRARQVANALDRLDLAFSDRVATLAWNGYRHFELYFGITGNAKPSPIDCSARRSRQAGWSQRVTSSGEFMWQHCRSRPLTVPVTGASTRPLIPQPLT